VTTHVSASVQTGEPTNLARQCDPIGLTAEVGGFARPNHGLTTVVTARGRRFVVEISEESRYFRLPLPVHGASGGRAPAQWLPRSSIRGSVLAGDILHRSGGTSQRPRLQREGALASVACVPNALALFTRDS
jgi:hypothetical protein